MTGTAGSGTSNLRGQLLMVGAGLAVIAVIAVIALLYLRDRAESKFTRNFVVALYGVKSGTDQCVKKSALLASGSRLADQDLGQLKSVRAEIYKSMQVLAPPPAKFSEVHGRLLTLAATYENLYTLASTSGPTPTVAASAALLEARFNKEAKELRSALDPQLLAELTARASRYSNLQFLLK